MDADILLHGVLLNSFVAGPVADDSPARPGRPSRTASKSPEFRVLPGSGRWYTPVVAKLRRSFQKSLVFCGFSRFRCLSLGIPPSPPRFLTFRKPTIRVFYRLNGGCRLGRPRRNDASSIRSEDRPMSERLFHSRRRGTSSTAPHNGGPGIPPAREGELADANKRIADSREIIREDARNRRQVARGVAHCADRSEIAICPLVIKCGLHMRSP